MVEKQWWESSGGDVVVGKRWCGSSGGWESSGVGAVVGGRAVVEEQLWGSNCGGTVVEEQWWRSSGGGAVVEE